VADRVSRIGALASVGAAVAIGAWLAATAVYRADDYGVVAAAWSGGSPGIAVAQWWDAHFETPLPDGLWPRFHRPVWRASFLVDAHLLGCNAALSALLSWALHCATAWTIGALCRRATGSPAWGWLACWLCLLPTAAFEAPAWIAARGSVLAAMFTVLAVAVAWRGALRPLRLIAVAALVLLAAGSHETGFAAAPVAAVALLLQPARRPGLARVAAAAVPLLAAAAMAAWRRVMLGGWVGGYSPKAPELGSPLALATGTGSVALPGHGVLPVAISVTAGAAALLALVAVVAGPLRRGGVRRDLLVVAMTAIVAFLAPLGSGVFRDADAGNGRALYGAHAAWTLALAIALHAVAGARPVLARVLATAVAAAAAVAFAVLLAGYARALATASALFAAVRTTPWPEHAVLLGMPDRDDCFLIARNAIGAAMQPPFRSPGLHLPSATDAELEHGMLAALAPVLPRVPDVQPWRWQRTHDRFEPGWWPDVARWRGAVTRDANGTLRCGGLRVGSVPPELAAQVPPGAWLELDVEARGDAGDPVLAVRAVRPWQPMLRALDDGTWQLRGDPGDWAFLLAGEQSCCHALGAAGALGVARAELVPIRVLESAQPLAFALPPAAAAARLLQPLVIFRGGVRLGEVHVRR
jgi:hypothetical protein